MIHQNKYSQTQIYYNMSNLFWAELFIEFVCSSVFFLSFNSGVKAILQLTGNYSKMSWVLGLSSPEICTIVRFVFMPPTDTSCPYAKNPKSSYYNS